MRSCLGLEGDDLHDLSSTSDVTEQLPLDGRVARMLHDVLAGILNWRTSDQNVASCQLPNVLGQMGPH